MSAAIRRDLSSALDPFAEILAQAESIVSHSPLGGRRRGAVPLFDDILCQAPEFLGDAETTRPAMIVAPARVGAFPPQTAKTTAAPTANAQRVAKPAETSAKSTRSDVSRSQAGSSSAASVSAPARPEITRDQRPAVPIERVDNARPLPAVVKVDPAGKTQPLSNVDKGKKSQKAAGFDESTPLTEAQVELMRALDEFDYDD